MSTSEIPKRGDRYIHQNGDVYRVLAVARHHERTDHLVVVYECAKTGQIAWYRELDNFQGTRNGQPRYALYDEEQVLNPRPKGDIPRNPISGKRPVPPVDGG